MRKLLFVVGGAGAGKTTLAKALARRRGAALMDMDTLLRPAAEAVMTLAGHDPDDRDSAVYKSLCRDLGYRITMNAALENLSVGTDIIVIGPFTKETADPDWLERELASIGATLKDVDVKVAVVYLRDELTYAERIRARGSALDRWKLDNWDVFSRSLALRQPKWRLPDGAVLYVDNSQPLEAQAVDVLESFMYGEADAPVGGDL